MASCNPGDHWHPGRWSYLHIYTWNPNDPYFDWKRPSKIEVIWALDIHMYIFIYPLWGFLSLYKEFEFDHSPNRKRLMDF